MLLHSSANQGLDGQVALLHVVGKLCRLANQNNVKIARHSPNPRAGGVQTRLDDPTKHLGFRRLIPLHSQRPVAPLKWPKNKFLKITFNRLGYQTHCHCFLLTTITAFYHNLNSQR